MLLWSGRLQTLPVVAALFAGQGGAQPCPSPPTKAGYVPAVYKNGYDNHDCVCGPPLGLSGAERLQCSVDGDTVHVEGTVQCSADTWSCFAKNADPLNPDHNIFAELPAMCRPDATTYMNITTWGGNCNVKCKSFLSGAVSIDSNGSMWLSSPKLSYAPGPVVPGSDTVWCGMIKFSFKKSAPPPPPLANAPCIRFGHTVPVPDHIDVEIRQDEEPSISHIWTNYKFADFSDWVNKFRPGKGTITIWENMGGVRGAQLYQLKGIPLTPGPLVVVLKVGSSQVANSSGYWPPAVPDSVETIAASYVQGAHSSKVRLFNLSPSTKSAGLTSSANGTAEIVSEVLYSLGSDWVDVPPVAAGGKPQLYSAIDDATKQPVATKTETPPAAPLAFTNFLVGSGGRFPVQLVPLVDAPEGGTCHP